MRRVVAAVLVAALVLTAGAIVFSVLAGGDDEPRSEAAAPAGGPPYRTVFVGDSITLGVSPETFGPDDAFSWVTYAVSSRSPWELQARAAVFGRTLGEMLMGFQTEVLALEPEAVVIMGGTNDTLRGVPVEESVAALRAMVEEAQDAEARVWVVSPPPLDPSYGRDPDPLLEAEAALAEELDVPYLDVRDDLADPDGTWQDGLSSDGVHPSEEGARRIADLVLAAVEAQ